MILLSQVQSEAGCSYPVSMVRKVELWDFIAARELKLVHFTYGEAESREVKLVSCSVFHCITFTSRMVQLVKSYQPAVRPA